MPPSWARFRGQTGASPPHAPRPSETLWPQESGHPALCLLTLPPGRPSLRPIPSLPTAPELLPPRRLLPGAEPDRGRSAPTLQLRSCPCAPAPARLGRAALPREAHATRWWPRGGPRRCAWVGRRAHLRRPTRAGRAAPARAPPWSACPRVVGFLGWASRVPPRSVSPVTPPLPSSQVSAGAAQDKQPLPASGGRPVRAGARGRAPAPSGLTRGG